MTAPETKMTTVKPSTGEELEIVLTKKGKRKIIEEGYEYVKNKDLSNEREKFECSNRRNKAACYASITVKDNRIVGKKNEHTHAPDTAKCEAIKILASMKQKALNTQETPHQIIGAVSDAISKKEIVPHLPTLDNIKRNLRAQRCDQDQEESSKLNAIIEKHRLITEGQDFLLHNGNEESIDGERKLIIFGTVESIEVLKQNKAWFMDGTFDASPNEFHQLYSIHCLMNGKVFPCIYALLTGKSQERYEEFLSLVREFCGDASPESITVDFELAAINAVKNVFPGCEVNGCYFHLTQNVYRKIQSLGFQQRYQQDMTFATACKLVPALAFVPVEDVPETFKKLEEYLHVRYPQLKP